ncbi:hypothetical protein C0991_006615 [Blastosporella zonata]|nr:hypothetical protein C0991_006615 [Blastosporella zonata]
MPSPLGCASQLEFVMKSLIPLLSLAAAANAHFTFQYLWVNGVDQGLNNFLRFPPSNNPVTDVTSTDLTCNVGGLAASATGTVTVPAGANLTFEWHQHAQRTGEDPISAGHKGPVQVYIAKAPSTAATFNGQGAVWTKIYSSGLLDPTTSTWATDVVNANSGKHSVKLPTSLPAGEYLVRAEILALHVASTYPGAQFYIGCAQIKLATGGSANPPKISLPGAYAGSDPGITSSASDKLFADAAREEADAKAQLKQSSRLAALESERENWDGDERIQDAVLRMLVDKYKPLRTGSIQTADQKLKLSPPGVRPRSQVTVMPITPSTGSWATEPLLPSKKDHQPWHTTFKVPEHATSSIKHAVLPPLPTRKSVKPAATDDRARRIEREEKKRTEHVGRLAKAKETTLDYRLGIRAPGEGLRGQVNPVSLKGWTNLVEDKIEKARKAGLFQNVKGRGKPLVSTMEEFNPFIAREEFLMNRIVQRNGAAPPWVEVQGELDTAVTTFRDILRQSWVRRVVRMITSTTPPALLHTVTLGDIKAFRDSDWERREHSYHQVALGELNALVRKYNGMAPYAVRRPYYVYSVEMGRLFEESAETILSELNARMQLNEPRDTTKASADGSATSGIGAQGSDGRLQIWYLRDLFKAWLQALLLKLWGKRRV